MIRSLIIVMLLSRALFSIQPEDAVGKLKAELAQAPETERSALCNRIVKRILLDDFKGDSGNEMLAYSLDAFRTARKLRQRDQETWALANIGLSYVSTNNPATAMRYVQKAKSRYRRITDKRTRLHVLDAIVNALFENNPNDEAVYPLLMEKKELETELGEKSELARTMLYLGIHLAAKEKPKEAMAHYENSVELFRQAGQLDQASLALEYLAGLCQKTGQAETARARLQEAIETANASGKFFYQERAYVMMGRFHQRQKQYDLAEQSMRQALSLKVEKENDEYHWSLFLLHVNMGGLYTESGKYEQALGQFRLGMDSLLRVSGSQDSGDIGYLNCKMAEVKARMGLPEEAEILFEKALAIATRKSIPKNRLQAHRGLGNLHLQGGDYEKSLFHFNRCLELAKKLNDRSQLPELFQLLSEVHDKMGHAKLAGEYRKKGTERKE